ncbi:hypothetical protein WN943_028455 [Citrus x changshan-huyou]|uniref:pathogenesis-related protein STH-2-like n=1 Tax=Citrus sinensis TaxID=2711 RepID=UPI000763B2C6|nr:pathogenesis-related protein STH-2-like [Citrus sinensis]XP_024035585.1 pathogenesis-related protein STH-2 [Citrus x clementina]
MGVASSAQELKSAIAPPPMFKALTLDANNFLPNPLPQFIKSLDRVLDAGGAGSVEQINFAEGSEYKYAKHKHQIDEVDEKNLMCKYAMIEGDALIDSLSKQLMRSNFEAAGGGGCICKTTINYRINRQL